MMYPPSMIAAGSICAAAHGLEGLFKTHPNTQLLQRLHEITSIDVVRIFTF